MIEIRYKRILFFQAFFLSALGAILYIFFKESFKLHAGSPFWFSYLGIWLGFIVFNLLFLTIFILPKVNLSTIEDTLSKKDGDLKKLQSEFEIENLKYKMLLDSLHDPVCIFSKDQIILYSNQAYNQLFSINESNSPAALIEVTRNLDFQQFVKQAIESNEALKIQDFSFSPLQDPYKLFYEIKIFPLKDIQTYLCLMHDVTERKMADQMREDFVSNFSHEVRTPLTILNGQMQNLKIDLEKEHEFEKRFKPVFEKIDNNSRRLINLFNDLLRLTSVEKKKDLNKENVDIEPMIHILVDELKVNYAGKKIAFEINLKDTIFYVDYNLFEQVMINLIDNALKYTPDGGTVAIQSYSNESYSIIDIADNGSGIPEDQLHRIFERFFRVDSSRSNNIEGTGLGLSITKHIIQKHDGKIKVQSKSGTGTTFTIHLPKNS